MSSQYRLGLISNAMTRSALRVLENQDLLQCFGSIVLSRDVGFRKPHSAIFKSALNEMGVSSEESVFVGDNAFTDVVGARRAGMNVIWISREGELELNGVKPSRMTS